MRLGVLNFRHCGWLAVFAATVVMSSPGFAAGRRLRLRSNTSVEVSNPKHGLNLPNAGDIGASDGSPQYRGPNYTGGHSLGKGGGSLSGAMPLPPPSRPASAAPSEGGNDLMDMSGSSPDQMLRNLAVREILGLPKNTFMTPDESAALLRSISGRSQTGRTPSSTHSSGSDWSGSDHGAGLGSVAGAGGKRSFGQSSLNNLIGSDLRGGASVPPSGSASSLSGLFGGAWGNHSSGPAGVQSSLASQAAQRSQLDAFKQMLNAQSSGALQSGFSRAGMNPNPWASKNPYGASSSAGETSAFGQAGLPSPFGQANRAFGRSVFGAATPPASSFANSAANNNSPLQPPSGPKVPVPSSMAPSSKKTISSANRYLPPRMDFTIPKRDF